MLYFVPCFVHINTVANYITNTYLLYKYSYICVLTKILFSKFIYLYDDMKLKRF